MRLCVKRRFGQSGFAARCAEGLRPSVAGRQRLDFYKAYLRLLNGKAEPYRTAAAQPLPEKAVFTQSLKPRHSGARRATTLLPQPV